MLLVPDTYCILIATSAIHNHTHNNNLGRLDKQRAWEADFTDHLSECSINAQGYKNAKRIWPKVTSLWRLPLSRFPPATDRHGQQIVYKASSLDKTTSFLFLNWQALIQYVRKQR